MNNVQLVGEVYFLDGQALKMVNGEVHFYIETLEEEPVKVYCRLPGKTIKRTKDVFLPGTIVSASGRIVGNKSIHGVHVLLSDIRVLKNGVKHKHEIEELASQISDVLDSLDDEEKEQTEECLVQDVLGIKEGEASDINNNGFYEQLVYLGESNGLGWLKTNYADVLERGEDGDEEDGDEEAE